MNEKLSEYLSIRLPFSTKRKLSELAAESSVSEVVRNLIERAARQKARKQASRDDDDARP